MTDICCIGHITLDKIITPHRTSYLNGGTAFYMSYAINCLPNIDYKLITSLAHSEMGAIEKMRNCGINVEVIPNCCTVYFENKYGKNMNNRTQRLLAKANPFKTEDLNNVNARYIHLGSLLADDFSLDVMKQLHGRGILSVDAQGFLRRVEGDKVFACSWKDKLMAFKYIDILKVNEHEIESLTGYSDLKTAATQLNEWGVNEVLITLGSYGSVIFHGGDFYEIPAYKPQRIEDATGCGDTYAAGYLYSKAKGASIIDAGKFAAAMCTLKIEHTGPFDRTETDILHILNK